MSRSINPPEFQKHSLPKGLRRLRGRRSIEKVDTNKMDRVSVCELTNRQGAQYTEHKPSFSMSPHRGDEQCGPRWMQGG
jgi:hypothetical protein